MSSCPNSMCQTESPSKISLCAKSSPSAGEHKISIRFEYTFDVKDILMCFRVWSRLSHFCQASRERRLTRFFLATSNIGPVHWDRRIVEELGHTHERHGYPNRLLIYHLHPTNRNDSKSPVRIFTISSPHSRLVISSKLYLFLGL
jgi:hypothetical protein